MSKIKLMTIVGTRPEIIRLSETIKCCDKYFEQILVHTGQNYDYELNQIFFEDLNLREPDYYLNSVGENLGETIGNVISKSYELMLKQKPDAVLVLGDTNSCLSVIAAKRLHIPIFHMEAGNRCFDECLPEETNRRIVDVTADVNMCYSEHARRYLNASGVPKERTFVTGSPMAEVLHSNIDRILSSDILKRLGLEKKKYILLSAHREENIDTESNFFSLMNSVNAMAEKYDMPIIYSCHPRSKKFIEKHNFVFDKRVVQHKPLGFHDYNNLQMNAFCVVSDSGTLPEESSFFLSIDKAFPAVCIRTSTERPEAMDRGNFILAGISGDQVLSAIETAVNMNKNKDYGLPVKDYMDENVSAKVVKIIQSYTGIVNKFVWRKD
ncbi:MAG: UDP-N-acetylglucosamine 2-epimerase (non-hydrolyzing) [Ruminococcus sp.]|nr:UDP-N-acetylglucosamine 2-epimerase (non-hydrolyzing) [Ruminococcus sp.]